MTIIAMFDRVKWIKGALSAFDGDERNSIKGTTTHTFLSLDSYNEESCGAVCAVGSIMFDLGATMDDFTDGIPFYRDGVLTTKPVDGYSRYDVFVTLLRRYTVEVAQDYFRNGDDGVPYLDSTNWYETAKSRVEAKGNHWYKDAPDSIEGFNDTQYSTEQDVRNFLDVLEWLPEYRMLHGVLTGDGDALKQIFEQAQRLDPEVANEQDYNGGYRLLQPIPYAVFNQIFGLKVRAYAD